MTTPDERQTQHPASDPDAAVFWMVAALGLLLAGGAGFVFYETVQIFAEGTSAWLQCVSGERGALLGCGEEVTVAYDYRYGLSALQGLALALAGLFVGPVPLIAALNRYRNHWVGAVLFFVVMIPYGTLAFLVIMIAALVTIFYGSQLVL